MAEATDRPQGSGEGSSSAAAWPERVAAPNGELGAMPPTTSESYRPLSLLAMTALALSVVYVLIVLIGGAVALFNHMPWLMPAWTFLLPFAVLLLSWVARNRIRNAEGTLSGLAFIVWAVRLTIVVGLSYLAYYGFTFFAVRLQAQEYADQFFKHLQEGQREKAFLLAKGTPPKNVPDADLRDTLEITLNSPTGPNLAPGAFSQFCQSQYVRTIEMSGAEARIVPKGVLDWGYVKGGYRVVMKYLVSTPLLEFEMSVEAFGRDGTKKGPQKGRQWQIYLQKGQTDVLPSSVKWTTRGHDYMAQATMAQDFAMTWEQKITRQQWDEVYLDTLEPAERERLRQGRNLADLLPMAAVAGLAPLGLCDEACGDFLNGRLTLAEGNLMRLDDKKLWTSKNNRQAILERLQQTFRLGAGGRPSFMIRPQPTSMPLSRLSDGRLAFLFDTQLTYLDEETGQPKYIAEGYIVVSAKEGEGDDPSSAWRIQAIEVSSARTPPKMPPRPGQPGGPGPRG